MAPSTAPPPRSRSPTTSRRRRSTCRPPTPADQTDSRLDQGDTIIFTFSEPIDPTSIVAGWDGTGSTHVIIRLSDTELLDDDEILVYNAANSSQLPLGVVDLDRTDYVVALFGEGTVTYGAPGGLPRR